MKKLFLIISFISSLLSIESKISKLINDDTIASWERKAILFTKDIGLKSRTISLDITYCVPYGKKRLCIPKGSYNFKITNELKDSSDELLYASLIKNRYDKIIFTKNGTTIITPTKTINTKSDNLAKASLNHTNKEAYTNSVHSFLDKIKKPISDILKDSIDQRYGEMSNQEKGSFFIQKAKSSGIPVEIISNLMNSSFAFSIYSSQIEGSIVINQFISKKLIPSFSATISINNKSNLFINKLNTKADPISFTKYKNINLSSSSVDSISGIVYPSNSMINKSISKSILSLYRDMANDYAYELVKDNNFAIMAPINGIKDNSVYANIGLMEDVRIDAPYIIRRTVNGEIEESGFVKNRMVFDNSYKNNKKQIGNSEFDVIQGSVDIISQLKEHPWKGQFFTIGGGVFAFETDNRIFKTKEAKGLSLGVNLDLGYMANSAFLSEVWFSSSMFYGITINEVSDESILVLAANIALAKRYYLGSSGLYFAPAIGIGGSVGKVEHDYLGDIQIGSVDFHTSLEIGFNIGADNEVSAYFDYDVPLDTFIKNDYVKLENEDYVKRGNSFGFAYKQHI